MTSQQATIKLVFFTHDSTCDGGAQLCLVDLIKGLKQQFPAIELHLLLPENGNMIDICRPYITSYKIIKTGGWWLYSKELRKNPFKKRIKYSLQLRTSQKQIKEYLRQICPDYAITNTVVIPQLAVTCKKLNIPHIWFVHEMPALTWDEYRFVYSNKSTYKKIDALSSKILVTSDFAKQFYSQLIKNTPIIPIAQAVEIENAKATSHHRYTLLIVGKFEESKCQLELLHALKMLKRRGVDAFCYFIGCNDNQYANQCRQYIEENELGDNVELVNFTNNVASYYNKSDVLVNCSKMESFGRVAVEAQLCGLPIVVSNVGANVERVMDGINGSIYRKNDINDLTDKLEYLSIAENRKQYADNLHLLNLEKHTLPVFAKTFLDLITK